MIHNFERILHIISTKIFVVFEIEHENRDQYAFYNVANDILTTE